MNGMKDSDTENEVINGMTAEQFETAVVARSRRLPAPAEEIGNLWSMGLTVEEAVEELRHLTLDTSRADQIKYDHACGYEE